MRPQVPCRLQRFDDLILQLAGGAVQVHRLNKLSNTSPKEEVLL
jgi:hypothetical protein